MKVEQAKRVLEDNGYFVDSLWHIEDVKSKSNGISDEDAMGVLEQALTNDWIMEQINVTIGDLVE
ncbi:hypothetical protein N9W01_00385 [bacterium]|nr:hypothetical protein [bacterium]